MFMSVFSLLTFLFVFYLVMTPSNIATYEQCGKTCGHDFSKLKTDLKLILAIMD
jgi:hypothetical protein